MYNEHRQGRPAWFDARPRTDTLCHTDVTLDIRRSASAGRAFLFALWLLAWYKGYIHGLHKTEARATEARAMDSDVGYMLLSALLDKPCIGVLSDKVRWIIRSWAYRG